MSETLEQKNIAGFVRFTKETDYLRGPDKYTSEITEAEDALWRECERLEAALRECRAQVIRECAELCRSMKTGGHWQNDDTRERCAKLIESQLEPVPHREEMR